MNARLLAMLTGASLICGVELARGGEGIAKPPAAEAGLEIGTRTITGDELVRRLAKTAAAAEQSLKAINTAHLKFRVFRQASDFKEDCTFARIEDLLAKHDLVAQPDSLREIVAAIMSEPLTAATPWSAMELFVLNDPQRGTFLRETRRNTNDGANEHVVGPEWSLRWDAGNAQMDVMPTKANRFAITQLHDFYNRLRIAALREPAAKASMRTATGTVLEADGRKLLEFWRPKGPDEERRMTFDEASGFFLRDEQVGENARVSRRWRGWIDAAPGLRFPRVVIEMKFENDQLSYATFYVVHEAKFNIALPETVFQLGAPAGAVIVTGDAGEERQARKINRDVFDVLSKEAVAEAMKPNEAPLTPEERDAIAGLEKIYALPEGDVLKRVGPPFPLSRKHLPRMLNPGHAESPRGESYYFVGWQDGRLEQEFSYQGAAPKVEGLIAQLLKHPLTDVDVPQDVLNRPMPGDYVYRPDATAKEMLPALASVLSQELGRPVLLLFQDVERSVYVARGELTLDEAKLRQFRDRPLIAMNGGDHDGDFGEVIGFGNLSDLVKELSDYVDVKIVNETAPSDKELSWSRRWYDLKRTPAEKRFVLKPEKVLEQISEQTGIEFVERNEPVRVLRMLQK